MRRDTITDLDSTIYCIAIQGVMIVAVLQKHIGFPSIYASLPQARLNGMAVQVCGIVHGMVCHGFVVPGRMIHLHTMPGNTIECMSHLL